MGPHGALVRAAGELDLAGRPVLDTALGAAIREARLVVLALEELEFVDWVGLRGLFDAQAEALAAGRRVLVTGLRPQLAGLLELSGTRDRIESLEDEDPRPLATTGPSPANPVNAAVVPARFMAVPDRWAWLQTPDDLIRRAWAPDPIPGVHPRGQAVQLYLDEHGAINGWVEPVSMLAVNQRGFDPEGAVPSAGEAMVCQGHCGTTWWAPDATGMEAQGEHCLTCAGPLVRH